MTNKSSDDRPEFLKTLGVMLPCTVDDVKQAYLAKSKTAHPDAGGDTATFVRIQEAFDRATEYAQFHASRTRWLAACIARYATQEEFSEELKRRGGSVETEKSHWLAAEIGEDFAQVLDKIVAVELTGPQVDDETLAFLVDHREVLSTLRRLNLTGSRISDKGLQTLRVFTGLHVLLLRDTPITQRVFELVEWLPKLEQLDVAGTRVNWWSRMKAKWKYSHLLVRHS